MRAAIQGAMSACKASRLVIGIVLSGGAMAGQLTSPPIYAKGPANGFVTCRVFTVGGTSVGERSGTVAIYANNARTPLPLVSNTCSPSMPPQNGACSFSAKIEGNLSYACVVTSASTQGANYTGTIELQNPDYTVLAREPMRSPF